jgi:hypothetical protein
MHVRVVPGRGSELFSLPAVTTFKRFDAKSSRLRDLDFFAVAVPQEVKPVYQEVKGLHAIGNEVPKSVFELSQIVVPSVDERYGFFGAVMPLDGGAFLELHPQIENDMQVVDENADAITFRLASKHKGHVAYQGCSGAPITDDANNVVSLVIGGDDKSDLIFGVPLCRYKSALVVTAMEAAAGR